MFVDRTKKNRNFSFRKRADEKERSSQGVPKMCPFESMLVSRNL